MSEGVQQTERIWRKEVPLPIGSVIAEMHKRDGLEWYEEQIEIRFAGPGIPQRLTKRTVGTPTLAQAQAQCDALMAELARMDWL